MRYHTKFLHIEVNLYLKHPSPSPFRQEFNALAWFMACARARAHFCALAPTQDQNLFHHLHKFYNLHASPIFFLVSRCKKNQIHKGEIEKGSACGEKRTDTTQYGKRK
jgi:hypothetical protein